MLIYSLIQPVFVQKIGASWHLRHGYSRGHKWHLRVFFLLGICLEFFGFFHSSINITFNTIIFNTTAFAKENIVSQDFPSKRVKIRPVNKLIEGPVLAGAILPLGQNPLLLSNHAASLPVQKNIDLAYGAFQRGYYLTALELALKRAETGDPAAQTLIGNLYKNGLGVGRDGKKAAQWYRFAADGGNRDAQFAYGNMLMRGNGVEQNEKLGSTYMEKAAKAGHALAQFNWAQFITARRPTYSTFKKALPFYEAAAKAGIADAQYALANIYAEARGVPYNDDKTAFQWLQKAAKSGFDTAQLDLALWFSQGRGTQKDLDKAFFWFNQAARQGNVIAQNRLAHIFAFGIGQPKDVVKAGAWHILSSRAGHSDSKMSTFFQGLSEIDQKRALEAAKQLSNFLRL